MVIFMCSSYMTTSTVWSTRSLVTEWRKNTAKEGTNHTDSFENSPQQSCTPRLYLFTSRVFVWSVYICLSHECVYKVSIFVYLLSVCIKCLYLFISRVCVQSVYICFPHNCLYKVSIFVYRTSVCTKCRYCLYVQSVYICISHECLYKVSIFINLKSVCFQCLYLLNSRLCV